MDEVTNENHVLRVQLEETEIKLQAERVKNHEMNEYYMKCRTKDEESKRKHDKALEEYYKYQMDQLQLKIQQLEGKLAVAVAKEESAESDCEEDYEEKEEVVFLDSDG